MGPYMVPKNRDPTFWRKKKPLRERAKPNRARNPQFWDPFGSFWALWAHTWPISGLFGFISTLLRPLWVPKGPKCAQEGPYRALCGPLRALWAHKGPNPDQVFTAETTLGPQGPKRAQFGSGIHRQNHIRAPWALEGPYGALYICEYIIGVPI